jgi:hypothetical protein
VNQVGALEPLLIDRAEAKMRKGKRPAARFEGAARAVHPVDAKQTIAESQAQPEFQKNFERLKAERLAREAIEEPKKGAPKDRL